MIFRILGIFCDFSDRIYQNDPPGGKKLYNALWAGGADNGRRT
nr:MAG TPA: hypothetical protein [Caudoviricetes sp.]DAU03304.1 MAG TPA: hypothetical protein [Caudoviricetes sp.]